MIKKYLEFYESPVGVRILEEEVGYLKGCLRGCQKILDVGCGPGVFERELGGFDITGIDSDEEMIEAARKACDNVFVVANAADLPFPDKSFDCVFYMTSMEFIDDYRKAVDETVRVLSGDGKLIVSMLNPESEYYREKVLSGGYISRYVNRNVEKIGEYMKEWFDLEEGFLLGIRNGVVFDSDDRECAALHVLRGVLR
ncbi:MAG: class I SAM-dependent methyltransferase [Candidatus Altiarchaeota archaeon]|nr:class I SAM-dependent methyltransferase [Candidatus Altiarchaeota archaeon]